MLAAKRWSKAFAPQNPPLPGPGTPAATMARERYLAGMRSPAPWQWQSDHLRESQRLKGAVYVALKVLGDQAASAELVCSRWKDDAKQHGDQDGKEPLPRNHPLCRLLSRPNRWDSGGNLRRRRVHQLGLTGTSLLWRVDNVSDLRNQRVPAELWSIPTGTYFPIPPSENYPLGGYRVMPYFPGPLAAIPGTWSAGGVEVPADYMVRTQHPHPLVQHEGLSPLSACDLALDALQSIDEARRTLPRRAISASAVIESDPTFRMPEGHELTRLRAEIETLSGGPNNSGRALLLSPGLKASPWNAGQIEVGWLESWGQLTDFVLSVYGVTKSLAFMSEDSSYAVLYAALKQFNLFTLCPLLDLLAEADNMQLVEPFWGYDYCIEYRPKRVIDEQLTEQQLANDIKVGLRTLNEIRALRDLPPAEWGEERAGAAEGKPEQEPEQPGQEQEEPEQARPDNKAGRGSLPPRIAARAQMNGNGKH